MSEDVEKSVEKQIKKGTDKALTELQEKREAVAQKIVDQLEESKKRKTGLNV